MLLLTIPHMHVYGINGKEVENIIFFQNGIIVLETGRSWIQGFRPDGYMVDVKSHESIEHIQSKRKVDLEYKDHFTAKLNGEFTLFLNLDKFKDVEFVDEYMYYETEIKKAYRSGIKFSGLFNDSLVSREITVLGKSNIREEMTEIGIRADKLQKHFASIGHSVPLYRCADIVKSADTVIGILKGEI